MATQITVTVRGNLGIDDTDDLLRQLANATGVVWEAQYPDGSHLT